MCAFEDAEIIEALRRKGFGDLLNALQDEKNFTKHGRVKKEAIARALKIRSCNVIPLCQSCREAAAKLSGYDAPPRVRRMQFRRKRRISRSLP